MECLEARMTLVNYYASKHELSAEDFEQVKLHSTTCIQCASKSGFLVKTIVFEEKDKVTCEQFQKRLMNYIASDTKAKYRITNFGVLHNHLVSCDSCYGQYVLLKLMGASSQAEQSAQVMEYPAFDLKFLKQKSPSDVIKFTVWEFVHDKISTVVSPRNIRIGELGPKLAVALGMPVLNSRRSPIPWYLSLIRDKSSLNLHYRQTLSSAGVLDGDKLVLVYFIQPGGGTPEQFKEMEIQRSRYLRSPLRVLHLVNYRISRWSQFLKCLWYRLRGYKADIYI